MAPYVPHIKKAQHWRFLYEYPLEYTWRLFNSGQLAKGWDPLGAVFHSLEQIGSPAKWDDVAETLGQFFHLL